VVPLTERALRDALPELISHLPTVQHAFALVDALAVGDHLEPEILVSRIHQPEQLIGKGQQVSPANSWCC